jgi:hypothetical protein
LACLDLITDPLAFVEAFESGSIDVSVMDEKILTIILLNKAIALLIAEPLHGSFCHSAFLLSNNFLHSQDKRFGKAKRPLKLVLQL